MDKFLELQGSNTGAIDVSFKNMQLTTRLTLKETIGPGSGLLFSGMFKDFKYKNRPERNILFGLFMS